MNLYSRILGLFLALAAIPAQCLEPSAQQWPVIAVHSPNTVAGVAEGVGISVVEVPVAEEKAFLNSLVQRVRQAKQSDPLLVVYREGEELSQSLEALPANDSRVATFRVDRNELASVAKPEQKKPSIESRGRSVANSFDDPGMRKAAYWITFTTGVGSGSMYFLTSETGPAAGALILSVVSAALFNGILYKKFPQTFSKFLNNSGKIAKAAVNAITGNRVVNTVAFEGGRIYGAFIWNFVNSGAFRLVLEGGDIEKAFGTSEARWNLAGIALLQVFSGTVWDLLFARLRARDEQSLENEKFVRSWSYVDQVIACSLYPFLFHPKTQPVAQAILGAYGTLGVTTMFYDRPFVRAAEWIYNKMTGRTQLPLAMPAMNPEASQALNKIRDEALALSEGSRCDRTLTMGQTSAR